MRRVCVVAMVGLVAAFLVSCGEGGGGANYSSPKATYETMWAAAKAGNKDAMMACFSDACRKNMAEFEKLFADMPKEMKEGKGTPSDDMISTAKTAKLELGAEKIDGDKATLEVTMAGDKETMDFIKEGGAWKVHIKDLAELDIEEMKKAMEIMKNLPKGMMEGLQKGLENLK
ncbi:MAG TPA: hypothetical protein VNE39_01980 [Planctomycetota bacterium]|nr:hypothetical protein [Planctomycetota bacterium]